MASNNKTYVTVGPIEVSKALVEGDKFMKWDEVSDTPVTMKVDPKGFFLVWTDQNNEMDLLDIATIRDVRTGSHARKPRDSKLRQIATIGSQDTLEDKTVSVCFGSDFVNMNFINFCCMSKDIAQHWTDELMKLAYSLAQLNGSTNNFLQKAYTKLCLQVDRSGKIPVKNIIKLFAQNKDDRKRVEKALDVSGLPSGKVEGLSISKFQFEDFFNLYKNLTQRSEVEKIFDSIVGNSKRRCMTTSQLVDFLNKTQRDPRLNEILYPYANTTRAKEIICDYEPNKFNAAKGLLSLDGFLRYLMSDDNPVMAPNKLDICDDMDQPLSHYFINSSHNTYLTGHQLTGKSSVEIYRQCLLAGCRCVELDFWNGRTEEPVIVHGYTFVPEINAKDVLEAIAESAFKTSEFPVILSFENHCNPRQQAKIANYCRELFGDMLLDKPIDSHPLESNTDLPPPALLRRKIIIKNKKKHHHHHHHHHHHKKAGAGGGSTNVGAAIATSTPQAVQNKLQSSNSVDAGRQQQVGGAGGIPIQQDELGNFQPGVQLAGTITGNGDIVNHPPSLQQIRQSSKDSTGSSDTDSTSDEESMPNSTMNPPSGNEPPSEKSQKETEAGAEISALVNYVQPVHFSSFENAEKKSRYYEMSSFDEKQATTLLKERPIEFVNYNKHQLSRVYPAGTRFDSSNFMPQLFWNAGCQLVALNFQTLDLAMQLNLGIFEYNERCGYLLKPEFMRRTDRRLDPFAESTVDGIIAGTVSITVLSGQFLSDKKVGTYVEVDMFGLPADTVRKKFRTKIVKENGINPLFDEEPFVFKKVVLPELASIRIAAYEENGKFIGHRVLPVIGLCPGYRHVTLRNEVGQPLTLASLFLCIIVKDYVPDGLSDFADALANPIKYQSELEKRDKQLAVLTEDTEPIADEGPYQSTNQVEKKLKTQETISGSPKRPSIPETSITSVEIQSDGHTGDSEQEHLIQPVSTSVPLISQPSLEQTSSIAIKQLETTVSIDLQEITAEPLEKIFEHKSIREKRLEMEKKLESLRKKHDKEKLKVASQKSSPTDSSSKKSKFLFIKRLSSKTLDVTAEVPPCPADINESSEDSGDRNVSGSSSAGGITRSQSERLLAVCKEYSTAYREIQEKYHEVIYSAAEKVLRNSQANQMKTLKQSLDKATHEVMEQLQEARRNDIKSLAAERRPRDELERMKREVASTMVDRGVAERVRLTKAYNKRCEDLQKQHDFVKNSLAEHKAKARNILEKDLESRSCGSSSGFLVLFHTTTHRPVTATSALSSDALAEGNGAIGGSQSTGNRISNSTSFTMES
ncbi:1-phosphatidylinositol 4,5-bisphosphate phosphodiesterase classes I and II [Condylostylus longicornis]|uniref:1-phosphatidylinositol 4,5-bisphosphate phosphodiesterase classes I and II n=1 Tax=Condylostylus longicornis TaxID=2530218 RepID=UPI00244DC31E|nr:1-phosphatidylinositol 4,5-bisphosphate phosphodiesterase classes I and II [Condylostylus longicornis]XP_055375772.1 1-phosphatidylinositol 4,5-bisphosphate phosphodiesterase classes I and II [Condylostylus longicornis]XP_055375773.1 1-phosphatidylinositol 4,5-bisphosphate phosphodiesterase classes I and II [Condylostylus longicornis]